MKMDWVHNWLMNFISRTRGDNLSGIWNHYERHNRRNISNHVWTQRRSISNHFLVSQRRSRYEYIWQRQAINSWGETLWHGRPNRMPSNKRSRKWTQISWRSSHRKLSVNYCRSLRQSHENIFTIFQFRRRLKSQAQWFTRVPICKPKSSVSCFHIRAHKFIGSSTDRRSINGITLSPRWLKTMTW